MDRLISKLTVVMLVFSLILGLHLTIIAPSAEAGIACVFCSTRCGSWSPLRWHTCFTCGSVCYCSEDPGGCVAYCYNDDGTDSEDIESCAVI
jgi:hypothetical protein